MICLYWAIMHGCIRRTIYFEYLLFYNIYSFHHSPMLIISDNIAARQATGLLNPIQQQWNREIPTIKPRRHGPYHIGHTISMLYQHLEISRIRTNIMKIITTTWNDFSNGGFIISVSRFLFLWKQMVAVFIDVSAEGNCIYRSYMVKF